jgi:hypothetical protein
MILPQPLQYAIERDLCRYVHLTVELTIPPSTEGTLESYINLPDEEKEKIVITSPETNKCKIVIEPPFKDYLWRVFSIKFGSLTAGTSTNVTFSITHFNTIMHTDHWVKSVIDEAHPYHLSILDDRPLIIEITNGEDSAQTLDFTIELVSFNRREHWEQYQNILRCQCGG